MSALGILFHKTHATKCHEFPETLNIEPRSSDYSPNPDTKIFFFSPDHEPFIQIKLTQTAFCSPHIKWQSAAYIEWKGQFWNLFTDKWLSAFQRRYKEHCDKYVICGHFRIVFCKYDLNETKVLDLSLNFLNNTQKCNFGSMTGLSLSDSLFKC